MGASFFIDRQVFRPWWHSSQIFEGVCWWTGTCPLSSFCLILNSCTYPSSWKHALAQPVPKKDGYSNPSNYRPIALTLSIAKVFETLIIHTSSNISNLTIFLQITSMAFVRQYLQGVFFPILFIPGYPLLGTSKNHLLLLVISLRHLTKSDARLW